MVHVSHLQEAYIWKYLCQQHNVYIVIFIIIISISMPKEISVSHGLKVSEVLMVNKSLTAVFSKMCFLHLEKTSLSNYAIEIRF